MCPYQKPYQNGSLRIYAMSCPKRDILPHANDQILQFPLGHVVHGLRVPVVLDITGGAYVLQHHLLGWCTQGDHQQDVHAFRDFKLSAQLVPLYVGDDTPSQSLFHRTQQDALAGDTVIAEKTIGDALVAQDDDVCRRPLPFLGPAPLLKVPGPG